MNSVAQGSAARFTTIVGLSIVLGSSVAMAAPAKCDLALTGTLAGHLTGKLNVIIRLDKTHRAENLRTLKGLGVDVYRHLNLIDSVAARVPAQELPAIKRLSFVKSISSDAKVQKNDLFSVGNTFANVAASQYGLSGAGVTVAVLDSGLYQVDDLGSGAGTLKSQSRILTSVNFSDDADAIDHCGHGTDVAGILAGNGYDSTGSTYTQTFLGIAPQVNLLNVKVLDRLGSGTVSSAVSAVSWCVNNQAQFNIKVINLSLGHPVGESYTTDPLCQAVEAAWKSGIVVVCAAGNQGRLHATPTAGAPNSGYGANYFSVNSPGNDPYVLTVGATKQVDSNRADDQIASYSGRGPSAVDFICKPDIIAPGNKIVSTQCKTSSYLVSNFPALTAVSLNTYMVGRPGNSTNYFVLSGTSMATPVVAGAAALLLQQQPGLSPDTVKARLMISADKWADPSGNGDPCTYGAGYLNIPAALNSTYVTSQYAMSPAMSEDGSGNVYIDLDPTFWGQRALWGTGLANLSSLYGQRALWGTNTVASSRALWGTGTWSIDGQSTIGSTSYDFSSGGVILNGEK